MLFLLPDMVGAFDLIDCIAWSRRDDWLDDLPPEWPITTEMQAGEEVDIEDQKLDELVNTPFTVVSTH